MIKYDIRYEKQTTGRLWWKKSVWAWSLYEERMVDTARVDDWYADMQPVRFKLESSECKKSLESIMRKLEEGTTYEERL